MTLRQKQSIFALNISKLIVWAYANGYEITKGEALRPYDMQLLYYYGYKLIFADKGLELRKSKKKSKTLKSFHLKKLAEDLNVFIDGKYRTDRDAFEALAEKWRSLHPKNISGYDWGWDYNHFQMG